MDDPVQLLSRLAAAMAEGPTDATLTARLSAATCRLLGADGASVSVGSTTTHRVIVHTTDDVAQRLEDLHDALGLGPAHDVFTHGAPVLVHVTAPDGEWSVFAEAAARQTPALLVVSVPMRAGTALVGVLTLYRSSPGDLEHRVEDACFLADVLGATILSEEGPGSDLEEPDSWPARAAIHQATGMVMAQLALGVEDALAVLRAHAFALDRTLQNVAASVVRRELVFPQEAHDD